MHCTRCEGTGYLNTDQIPEMAIPDFSAEEIGKWVAVQTEPHDVQVCDCCGDGDTAWYGTPGEHYTNNDPRGPNGPYAHNGGLCQCH